MIILIFLFEDEQSGEEHKNEFLNFEHLLYFSNGEINKLGKNYAAIQHDHTFEFFANFFSLIHPKK